MMKIGDKVYVHGFVDEIRRDTVIIRNEGGYFGTVKEEVRDGVDAVKVVRCEDCRHATECHKSVHYTRNEPNIVTIGYSPIEWCSRGERRSE